MKAYQRRELGIETVFNLNAWDNRLGCWTKIGHQFATEQAARNAAVKPGRYRISESRNGERIEHEPFVRPMLGQLDFLGETP